MGFSSPKAVKPEPAPPPVTTNASEVARAQQDEIRLQEGRFSMEDTMNPNVPRRSLLPKNRTRPAGRPQLGGKSLLA